MKTKNSLDDLQSKTPTLLRKGELAKTLRVSSRTVENWMQSKVIPYYKIKGVTLFDLSRVMDALGRFERAETRVNLKSR